MRKSVGWSICFLIVFSSLAFVNAETQITPATKFSLPQLNSEINFATNVSYASAELQNNTWYFTGLQADGKAGYPISGHLHISAQSCNVSINYLQAWSQPEMGSVGFQWIKYSVEGAGIQTLDANDLFPNSNKWTQWTVIINGNISQIGETWNYTDSKQLVIKTERPTSFVEINVQHTAESSDTAPLSPPAPAAVNFTSKNHFQIPSSNATINFAVDGSYDQANLNNDSWEFTNLTLSTYAINAGIFAPNVTGRNVLPYILQAGYPATLGVSGQECNVTITGITPLTWHSHEPSINYTVQGIGSQIFTFPFKLTDFRWTITIDGATKQNGDGWFIVDDYQFKIVNATQQVEISGITLPTISPPIDIFYIPIILSFVIIGVAVAVGSAALILYRRRKLRRSNLIFS